MRGARALPRLLNHRTLVRETIIFLTYWLQPGMLAMTDYASFFFPGCKKGIAFSLFFWYNKPEKRDRRTFVYELWQ